MEVKTKIDGIPEFTQTQLRSLTDQEVLNRTKLLAIEERKITAQVVQILEEIDTRKIFAKLGFSSLFEFLTQEIGYSAGAAQRRINAMRVVRAIPEVKEKIVDGSLNLSNVAQAQKFFNLEAKQGLPLTIDEKKEVLSKIENKSTREAEKELLSLSSNPLQMISDRVKPITPEHSEIRFIATHELLEKLNQVRGLLAHKNSRLTIAEIIEELATIGLQQLTKKKYKTESSRASQPETKSEAKTSGASPQPNQTGTTQSELTSKPENDSHRSCVSSADNEHRIQQDSTSTPPLEIPKNRHIPANIKRAVFQRDQGRCTYRSPETGKCCESKFGLEYEHLKPYAHGGSHSVDNLTLRCRAHNMLSAANYFDTRFD